MYSFKGFWLPFIILIVLVGVVMAITPDTDTVSGLLLFGIFYFYNRGYNNAKKEDGK